MRKTFYDLGNISLIMLFFIVSSCGQVNKKNLQEYSGTYKTNDEKSCPIEVIITSQNDGYRYKIKTSAREKEGRLEITKTGKEVYLKFIGLPGTKPNDEIEGQFINNTIAIQNYGNSMNEYIQFGECDSKYFELLKIENK